MNRINFETRKPDFINQEGVKWYFDEFLNNYISNEQAFNLPKLENLGCFVVKGPDYIDYVLINDEQKILASYSYSTEGYEQIIAKINIIKISKHFDENEQVNI